MKRVSQASALLVGAGIFFSRIAGLLRDKIFAYYFGSSAAGDVFRAALRIPNFLQNLLGEGVLSGSFIPIYARLLAEKRDDEARELAGAVLGVLATFTTFVVALGVLFSPVLIDVIAPGFEGERRELCVQLVRILFPGIGFLVLSAYCLGVLNSHRKFFLSYSAPVLWNLAIIVALAVWGPHTEQNALILIAGYGVVAGCLLQFIVQVPTVVGLLKGVPFHLSRKIFSRDSHFRKVLKNFVPIVTGRGVVQISAYVDTMIASYLPIGALSVLGYAQTLYLLPVSLFGMSISAAELPAMSQATGSDAEIAAALQKRIIAACRKISIFIIPSAAAFIFLGPLILKILYRGGAFDEQTSRLVWFTLMGSTVGILATTQGRVYASSFYALRDAQTPLSYAVVRVFFTIVLGLLLAFQAPDWFGIDRVYGTVGLTAGFGISGWMEFLMLKKKLSARVGQTDLPFAFISRTWIAALVPAILLFVVSRKIPALKNTVLASLFSLGFYGVAYFSLASLMGIDEVRALLRGAFRKIPFRA